MKTLKPFLTCLAIAGLIVGLAGCASSRLSVRLDIYGEDPAKPDLTVGQILYYQQALKSASNVVVEYTAGRIALGSNVFETFKLLRHGTSTNTVQLEREENVLSGYLVAYTNLLAQKGEAVLRNLAAASAHLAGYTDLIRNPAKRGPEIDREQERTALSLNCREAAKGMAELFTALGTHFENRLSRQLPALGATLLNTSATSRLSKDDLKKLQVQVAELQEQTRKLADQGNRQVRAFNEAVARLDDSQEGGPVSEAQATPAQLTNVSIVLSNVSLSPEPSKNAVKVQKAVDGLPNSQSDVERQQDPADPFWRIIADPRNEGRWHSAFVTNLFYAEGKNSVIIVRDSPIMYRVQRGNNNPAALIEGQLRISRAIGDAAIQIAGSAAGVHMPPLPKKGTNNVAQTGTNTVQDSSIGETNAQLDEYANARRLALGTLRRRLTVLRAEFQKNDDNNRTNLLNDFQVAVRSSAFLFRHSETNAPPP